MARIPLKVNGKTNVIDADSDMPLLYALRNDLRLNGPKFGCGMAQCGACTVIMEGNAIRSCVTPVSAVQNIPVTTLEGLGTRACPGPTQQAFIDCQAAQCGYCLNGMVMTVEALLRRNPDPSEQEVRSELHHNLCRCGTHVEILQAALRAARLRVGGTAADGGTGADGGPVAPEVRP